MRFKLVIPAILIIAITITADKSVAQVIAQDGKTYSTHLIGKQNWMTENLNVSTFKNGDAIMEAQTASDWAKAAAEEKPAWCYYMNDNGKDTITGKLYNWFAVTDPRGLAPEGWHVPTTHEFNVLIKFVGEKNGGTKIKSNSGWLYNGNGTNESGFNAKPGGYRYDDGSFNAIGIGGGWWTSTEKDRFTANFFYVYFNAANIISHYSAKDGGLSVRCIENK